MLSKIAGTLLPAPPWGEISFDVVIGYHDGPRIMVERDPTGQLYLVWWNDVDDAVERWVGLPLSKGRLQAILSDEMKPREAMENPEDGYLLVVDIDLETDTPARVVKTTAAAVPQDSLPRPEATLKMPMPAGL